MKLDLWWLHPRRSLACGLGLGLLPFAPGTWGTLLGVALYLPIAGLPMLTQLGIVACLAAAGVWICHRTALELGSHDPSSVVWDEVVGYLLCMAGAPAGWIWPVIGFALFRCFDILKPWPLKRVEREIPGGLGIMLDDLLAGGYALVCMQLIALTLG